MGPVRFREGSYGFLAELNYEDLHALSEVSPMRCRSVCLHCHLCVEGYLMQVIREAGNAMGDPIFRSHNLISIARKAEYPNTDKFLPELTVLNTVYSYGRYLNNDGHVYNEPTLEEAQRTLKS